MHRKKIVNEWAHGNVDNFAVVQEEHMQCLFLLMAALVYFMYAYLAFNEKLPKDCLSFFVATMVVGFFYNILWYWSTRLITEKTEYFLFVLLWDFVYIAVFYFTPVFLFGVKLDKWGVIGVISMIAGLLVMKMGHK